MAAVMFFIASGFTAGLWSGLLRLPRRGSLRVLSALVLWETLQIVPVHGMAALQIAGKIRRINPGVLAWAQVAILLFTCAGLLICRRQPAHPHARSHGASGDKLPFYVLLSAGILAGSYLVFAVNLFTSYPTGPDALGYHIPLALRWLQQGSLQIPESKGWPFSFPGNAEIGFMLLLQTGRQSLVPLVNWLAIAVLALATYLIANRLSQGNRVAALAATFLVLSIPMVEFQMFSGYIDVFGTAFLLAAVALFLYRYPPEDSTGERPTPLSTALLVISALACGISVGSKSIYYVYGAVYVVLAVATLMWESPRHRRPVVALVAIVALATLLPCVFWFGRGLRAAGNPVYPLQVKVAGHVIFPGYAPSDIAPGNYGSNFVTFPSRWILYPWTEWKRNPGYLLVPYSTGDGFGAAFATFVPLALLFAFYVSFVRRTGGPAQSILLLAWFPMLAVWWFAMSQVLRYGLPLWVIGCALAAGLVSVLDTGNSRMFRALLVSSVLTTCTISAFVPFHELAGRIRIGKWTRADFYGYPAVIDELPAGARVLNSTGIPDVNFVLAGKKLSNRVIPAFEAPAELTPEFIRKDKVDYVVEAMPPGQNGPPLRLPGASIYDDEVIVNGDLKVRWRVWKVDPQPAATSALFSP